MAGKTVFPAFIRAEYDASSTGFAQFERAAADAVGRTKRQFERDFAEIGQVIGDTLSRGLKTSGAIDLNVGQFRQAAAEAKAYSEALNVTFTTARRLAEETGDTSNATRVYIQALRAQTVEAEQASAAAVAQVQTYERLQSALDQTASRTGVLAQSYRALYAEQAKSAQAEVAAREAQRAYEQVFSPGVGRESKSASQSAQVFQEAEAQAKAEAAALELAAQAEARLAQAADRAWAELNKQTAAMADAATQARITREATLAAASAFAQPTRASQFDAQVQGYKELAAAALAVERSESGSLNLGVDQHRAAAEAAEAHALVLRDLVAGLERTALAQQDVSESTRLEIQAARAAAVEEEKTASALRAKVGALEQLQGELSRTVSSTSAVIGSQDKFTQSLFRGNDGLRASRFAMIQVGQQIQDIGIGFAGGQRAATIFAQQLPQLGFALIGFENNASKALSTLGKFGVFLSGPWGAAITVGTIALGALTGAFDYAGKASYKFGDAINFQKLAIGDLIEAIDQLEKAEQKQIQSSYDAEQQHLREAEAALKAATAKRELAKAALEAFKAEQTRTVSADPGATGAAAGLGAFGAIVDAQIDALDASIGKAQKLVQETNIPILQRQAKADVDAVAASTLKFDKAMSDLNKKFVDGKVTQAAYRTEAGRLTKVHEDEVKAARGADAARRRAAREALSTAQAQASAETQLQKIIEKNTEQPTRIVRANTQLADIDQIETRLRLSGRLTDDLRGKIAEAREAIRNDLLQPYNEFIKAQQESLAVGQLLAQGRDVEAGALRDIFNLQRQVGDLNKDQIAQVLGLAQAQEQISDAIDEQRRHIDAYMGAVAEARQTFNSFLTDLQLKPEDAFKNLAKNWRNAFANLQANLLTNQLFQGVDRDIKNLLTGQSGIQAANDYLADQVTASGNALDDLIKALHDASQRIANEAFKAANDNFSGTIGGAFGSTSLTGGFQADQSLLRDVLALSRGQRSDILGESVDQTADIIVNAGATFRASVSQGADTAKKNFASASEAFDLMSARIVKNLEGVLGVQLPGSVSGVLAGGLSGYAQAGPVGAVLGALKGIKNLPDDLKETFGTLLSGAQTGLLVGGLTGNGAANKIGGSIGGALGKELGKQVLGKALGSFAGPVGSIVGGLVGGLLGGLFSKTKKGSATLGFDSFGGLGVSSTSGNTKSYIQGATADANNVIGTLQNIAAQLGGELTGPLSVSIGRRKKSFVVDTTGQGRTKGAGTEKFADESLAIQAAIADALRDGVIQGVKAGTQRLLSSAAGSLDQQVTKAAKFEGVFKELKQATDPVGAAIDDLNNRFEDLKRVFAEAGASAEEYTQLEQLYAIQRKNAVEQASSQMTSTLKSLMSDLTTNNDALSLRDRLTSALGEYNPLAQRVAAGDTTVNYDDFAEAARNLLDIERQLNGSQDDYFAKLKEVTDLTAQALAGQENLISIASSNNTPFDVPSSGTASNDNSGVVNAIGDQTSTLAAQLAQLNLTSSQTKTYLENLLSTNGAARQLYTQNNF